MSADQAMKQLKAEIGSHLDRVFADLRGELVRQTPKRSGTASRGWQKTGSFEPGRQQAPQEVLRNDVPYVGLLEQGRSRQAPRGMITPSVDAVNRRNNQR